MLHGYGQTLIAGAAVTLEVAFAAAALGLVLGLALGLASISRSTALRRTVRVATGLLRGVPELVILLVCFYGASAVLYRVSGGSLSVSPFAAGAGALGLTFAAYAAEAFRGAFASVPRGQAEAALSLGLSPSAAFRAITLPQALRLAVPSLSNQWQTLLKDTSLVSVIGLGDIMQRADAGGQATGAPFTFFLAASAIYFMFLGISQPLLSALERRTRRGVLP